MILPCPLCTKDMPVVAVYHAEKMYNTETKEVEYNDVDFSHFECPECHYNFGDDRDVPPDKQAEAKTYIKQGWEVF